MIGRETGGGMAGAHERLLQITLDTLPVGVIMVDVKGDIVLVNRAATLGWGRMIVEGVERWHRSPGWWHDTGAPVKPEEWASVRALVDGRPHLAQIIDIESTDGTRRTISNSAVPIIGESGLEGAVILNEDITDRLLLQAQLVESQKMDVVGRLASGVAHDFNNMLTVIQAYTDLLVRSFSNDDPRHDDLVEVRKATDSATALTRQLLGFGRREHKQPRHIVLEVVVAEAVKLLSRVLADQILFIADLDPHSNVLWIDPFQLEQVIMNLALNARDAMPHGGELRLATKRVDSAAGPRAVLSVTDTGTGMDEDTARRIFEPFFTTKPRDRGTGLGLSTVHTIVRESGGAIAVTSAPGQGTTFTVEFPVSVVPAVDPRPPVPVSAPRGSERVLLVESSPPVRLAVAAMLRNLGYIVHPVPDAAHALEYAAAGGAIDVVITDVNLRGTSGRELGDALVARDAGIHVLLTSGYGDLDAQLDAGTRAYPVLAKPFSIDSLAVAVREVLAA